MSSEISVGLSRHYCTYSLYHTGSCQKDSDELRQRENLSKGVTVDVDLSVSRDFLTLFATPTKRREEHRERATMITFR